MTSRAQTIVCSPSVVRLTLVVVHKSRLRTRASSAWPNLRRNAFPLALSWQASPLDCRVFRVFRNYRDSHSGVKTQSLVERPEAEAQGSHVGARKGPSHWKALCGALMPKIDQIASAFPHLPEAVSPASGAPARELAPFRNPSRGWKCVLISAIDPRTNARGSLAESKGRVQHRGPSQVQIYSTCPSN